MRATGNSESMVRSLGINPLNLRIFGLALANGLTGISGFLLCQYQGYTDVNMGIGIIITGLGAVTIGDTLSSFFPYLGIGFKIISVILGGLLFQLILALTLSLGVDPNWLKFITALIVLIVVMIPALKNKSYDTI